MAGVRTGAGWVAAFSIATAATFAAPPVPLGGEIPINSHTTESQRMPGVAIDAGGRFVVVWESYDQDGDAGGIFGQRFSEAGLPLGSEFQVAESTSTDQTQPAVAMTAAGDFVVVWTSESQDGDDGAIFARVFDDAGAPQTGEMLVNTFTLGDQSLPAVAIDDDGDLIVVWDSFRQFPSSRRVLARRFDSAGQAQGGEFIVNGISTGPPTYPAVAIRADGSFVVVWQSHEAEDDDDDEGGNGVLARRFDAAGSPVSAPVRVNSYTENEQQRPAVSVDAAGNFVVVWESLEQDGQGWGVFGQRFASSGAAAGAEFVVPAFTASDQRLPAVAKDASGGFVVAWQSYRTPAEYEIAVRRVAASGAKDGGEIAVNTFTVGAQLDASVAMGGDGTFVVAWESSYHQDGDQAGVFARRFDIASATPSPSPTAIATETSTATPTLTAVATDTSTATSTSTASPSPSPSATLTATPTATETSTTTPTATWTATATLTATPSSTGTATGTVTPTPTSTVTPTATATPTVEPATLDVDGSGAITALTDGLLVLRFHFGLTGGALVAGAVSPSCTRCDGSTVASYLTALGDVLDVDGNGSLEPLTDGLLVLRYLFGLTGATLTNGVVGASCTRCDAAAILPYLETLD